jgi:N-ethylmaleimide reductase
MAIPSPFEIIPSEYHLTAICMTGILGFAIAMVGRRSTLKGFSHKVLHDPLSIGGIKCKNKIVMAPLTRMRASPGDFIPSPLAKEYYSQRAGAGLIIVEATQISQLASGYPLTPGIYSAEQTAAWKEIVDAVHAKDGKVVMQLWHVGRISHTDHHPKQGLPVAPSAIAPKDGKVFLPTFQQVDYEVPRAMTLEDIKNTIADFVKCAENSLAAGFDGIEVHAANGYLLDQFLEDGTNKRDDKYGGSVENRMRFLVEVLKAVCQVYPANKVGVRLSPFGEFNDMQDSDPVGLFTAVCAKMQDLGLGYVHVIEPRSTNAGGGEDVLEGKPRTSAVFRNAFGGSFISAGGYSQNDAIQTVGKGDADAIAFGRLYISNPDLAERFATGPNAEVNKYDRATFYGGGAEGYTDYPTMD